ncbi:MAG: hypothetical protein RQ760_11130 [Sedimentisphaerales bacterium]|nr:hypothetical protein [Sedimentisphaerales bacterium]
MSTEEKPQIPEKSQKTTLEEPQEDVCLERQRRGEYIANADNTEPPGRGHYLTGANNIESSEEIEPPESETTSF